MQVAKQLEEKEIQIAELKALCEQQKVFLCLNIIILSVQSAANNVPIMTKQQRLYFMLIFYLIMQLRLLYNSSLLLH